MKWMTRIGIVVLVAVVAFGVVGMAAAQGPDDDPRPQGPERGGPRHGNPLVGAVAEAAGLTPEEMQARLDAGELLSDIIAEYELDADALVESVRAELVTRLEEAVANGHLTEEEMAQKLEEANANTELFLNSPKEEWPVPEKREGGPGERPGGPGRPGEQGPQQGEPGGQPAPQQNSPEAQPNA